ncbi:MAG: thiamine phosphate synthase [Acidiferrobacterales bacterium]
MTTAEIVTGLYAIADTDCIAAERLAEAVALAIEGGARVIQYRDKSDSRSLRERQAGELARVCETHGVPLIVNDDPTLAGSVGAAGVHLGRDDPAVADARKRLGESAIIGVSCYNRLELALAAQACGADYIAFGSFFPSATKPAAVRASLGLLREARQRLRVPIVAIGGITPENGGALMTAGADALAVVQGVFTAPDIRQAARRYAVLFSPGME